MSTLLSLTLLFVTLTQRLALSLKCSQCHEMTVNGQYYGDGPRDCLSPSLILCEENEDSCVSAEISFDLKSNGKKL